MRVFLTTYPYHAQYLMLFRELGLWPEFERWKRLLVQTVERESMHAPQSSPVDLWDFAAFSPYATLPIARDASDGAGRWYWEAGHFKKELGDLMLNEIFRPAVPAATGITIGTSLTSRSLDSWCTDQRIAAELFAQGHPDLVRQVRAAIERARIAKP